VPENRLRLTRTALLFLGYLIVAIAAWTFVGPLYDSAIAVSSGQILRNVENVRMTGGIGVDGAYTLVGHAPAFAHLPDQRLELRTHHNNVPFLVALILATPGLTWPQRKRCLAVGLGLLALTHIGHFILAVHSYYAYYNVGPYEVTDLRYLDRGFWSSLDNPAQTAKNLLSMGESAYERVGRLVAPILIWLLVCGRRLADALSLREAQ